MFDVRFVSGGRVGLGVSFVGLVCIVIFDFC